MVDVRVMLEEEFEKPPGFDLIMEETAKEVEKCILGAGELLSLLKPGYDMVPNTAFLIACRLIVGASVRMATVEAGKKLDPRDPLVAKYVKIFAGTLTHYPDMDSSAKNFLSESMQSKGPIQ